MKVALGDFVRCLSHKGEPIIGRVVDLRGDRGLALVAWPHSAHDLDKVYLPVADLEPVSLGSAKVRAADAAAQVACG